MLAAPYALMDKRFLSLFDLSPEQAIAILDKPQDEIGETESRYVAAAHLVHFPSEAAIAALIRAIQTTDTSLENRIVRRKAVETLGRLKAKQALDTIYTCLEDEDCYMVENAVWAMGEIGTQNIDHLAAITQVLERPGQTYRVAIHTLATLQHQPALHHIETFTDVEDKPTVSAAIAAIYRLTGNDTQMHRVVDFLQAPDRVTRRASIQDLIDAKFYTAIPNIARCPESIAFRLRALRLLTEAGVTAGALTFADVQPYLEQTLRDHPQTLALVHEYDQPPSLEFLIHELYDTDFGRCYLATQTLINEYPTTAPTALLQTYAEEAHLDYGAHYHVIKLLGWLRYKPAATLLKEALYNEAPQFQKSRAAAAIALGELGDTQVIPDLQAVLALPIWDLQYAALMALAQLGETGDATRIGLNADWMVQAKATSHTTLKT
jgi:bilin biosynthesis protein